LVVQPTPPAKISEYSLADLGSLPGRQVGWGSELLAKDPIGGMLSIGDTEDALYLAQTIRIHAINCRST
jgi:hypothetical protein